MLISNAATVRVMREESNTIYEKDYYVIIMDDLNKVTHVIHTALE